MKSQELHDPGSTQPGSNGESRSKGPGNSQRTGAPSTKRCGDALRIKGPGRPPPRLRHGHPPAEQYRPGGRPAAAYRGSREPSRRQDLRTGATPRGAGGAHAQRHISADQAQQKLNNSSHCCRHDIGSRRPKAVEPKSRRLQRRTHLRPKKRGGSISGNHRNKRMANKIPGGRGRPGDQSPGSNEQSTRRHSLSRRPDPPQGRENTIHPLPAETTRNKPTQNFHTASAVQLVRQKRPVHLSANGLQLQNSVMGQTGCGTDPGNRPCSPQVRQSPLELLEEIKEKRELKPKAKTPHSGSDEVYPRGGSGPA